jgi:hypothetical protein
LVRKPLISNALNVVPLYVINLILDIGPCRFSLLGKKTFANPPNPIPNEGTP